jgi:hypothetical protein
MSKTRTACLAKNHNLKQFEGYTRTAFLAERVHGGAWLEILESQYHEDTYYKALGFRV